MPADRRELALIQTWLNSSGEDQGQGLAELLERLRLSISNLSSLGVITFAQTPIFPGGATLLTNPLTVTLLFSPDATFDIGATGASRPRDIFVSRDITLGRDAVIAGVIKAGSGVVVLTDATGKIVAIDATRFASLNGSALTNLTAGNLTGTYAALDGSLITLLNASNLGSGTVPTARLGSGTASSTTFLSGDQTYKKTPFGIYIPTLSNVLNTAIETTVADWSIPASDIADGDALEILFYFLAKNNKGTSGTMTAKINIGASAQATLVGAATWSNNAAEFRASHPLYLVRIGADLWVNDRSDVTALWNSDVPGTVGTQLITPANWTSTQSLQLKVTLSAADASFYLKPQSAVLRRIRNT